MVTLMLAVARNSSAPRFWVLPTLTVPTLSLPGLARASLRKSPSVPYGPVALVVKVRSNRLKPETGVKSFTGSNGRVLNSGTLMAVPFVTSASVYPSAGAASTDRAAEIPPAPGWLSTMKRAPNCSPSFSAISRVVMSPTRPPRTATMIRTGRVRIILRAPRQDRR